MSTQTNKSLTIIENIKSIAIALVGAGMAGKGITYFSPKLSYDVPRILLPVFNALGHKGLAASMVLLGIILLVWSYYRWKKSNGKPQHWALIAGTLTLLIIGGVYIMDQPKNNTTVATNSTATNKPAIQIGDATTVSFPASFAPTAKEQYETLIKNMEAAIAAKDKSKCWKAYNALNIFTASLKPNQNNPEELQFILTQTKRMDVYNQQIKALSSQ